MFRKIAFYGTCSFFGRFPMPGTMASLLSCLIFTFLSSLLPLHMLVLIGLILFALGWLFTYMYILHQDDKDPREVTIDEVAGMWLALCFIPLDIFSMISCFLLFRALDIMKPPPISTIEKTPMLPFSLRVMLDDLIAGISAGMLTLFLIRSGLLPSFLSTFHRLISG